MQGEDEFCIDDSPVKCVTKSTSRKTVSLKLVENNTHSDLLYKNHTSQIYPNIFHENGKQFNFYKSCKNPNYLPCYLGHDYCFPPHNLCLYELDHRFKLIICRNGAHLYNCTLFQCSRQFKCPRYYCIPFKYICDGKWDCPFGSDEMTCRSVNLSKSF